MIRCERAGEIVVVRLSRPDRRNALTPEMVDEFRTHVLSVGDARAIVIAGEGGMFCSGFDLAMCQADPTGGVLRRLLAGLSAAIRTLRASPVPVVVAAEGGAIAGGCALLGGADLVIANRQAKFGYPVHRLGVSPAVSAPTLTPSVQSGGTRRLQMEGALIGGDEAYRIGLVHILVEQPEQVLPAALDHAVSLASRPGDAIIETRQWLRVITDKLIGDNALWNDAALATSLSLVGGSEERTLLKVSATHSTRPTKGPTPRS